ncbi:unnamed protein product [Psylliodes chrysocephalus]|uniref:Uncharacterized protein n=1 Tax=Psylliodes chrysocephalus TaxID=3402493 RepID=A0A9P0CKU4_9CUCU|nr:unnamed protein product [Psylliodes chrysocephala]
MTVTMIILQMVLLAIGVYSLSIDSWDVNDWEFINGLNKPDSFKTKSIFEDFNINEVTRNKKSAPRCAVKMVAKYHPNDGFDYYPKKYHEYECVPVTNDLSVIDTDFPYQDVCFVTDKECESIEKKVIFARKHNSSRVCGMEPHHRPLKVGCRCIHHYKYHFL